MVLVIGALIVIEKSFKKTYAIRSSAVNKPTSWM